MCSLIMPSFCHFWFATFVAWEAQKPLVIKDVEVAPPQKMEVRVKILFQLSLPHRCLLLGSQGLKKKLFTLTWECSTCSNVEFSGLDIGWGQRIPMKFDEERGLLILQGELLGQNPLLPGHTAPAVSKREKAGNVEIAQQIGKMK
ncbi:hypothetical protein RHMOL_Rhmol08G0030000 [Rhododendron molle]|uniref:Uncharacterized protein n=1 Tax=Rhododendron molle TaxID=49168 RepID=A0ACC0MKZ2_RHOML|nr:hypothetical protein RHMOL_Rhmol08G0030000 [Rhododendron molle]